MGWRAGAWASTRGLGAACSRGLLAGAGLLVPEPVARAAGTGSTDPDERSHVSVTAKATAGSISSLRWLDSYASSRYGRIR
jgi:hypothetical protein